MKRATPNSWAYLSAKGTAAMNAALSASISGATKYRRKQAAAIYRGVLVGLLGLAKWTAKNV